MTQLLSCNHNVTFKFLNFSKIWRYSLLLVLYHETSTVFIFTYIFCLPRPLFEHHLVPLYSSSHLFLLLLVSLHPSLLQLLIVALSSPTETHKPRRTLRCWPLSTSHSETTPCFRFCISLGRGLKAHELFTNHKWNIALLNQKEPYIRTLAFQHGGKIGRNSALVPNSHHSFFHHLHSDESIRVLDHTK